MFQVFQLLELPTELDRLETYQALLVTKRTLLMNTLTNLTNMAMPDYEQVLYSIIIVNCQ